MCPWGRCKGECDRKNGVAQPEQEEYGVAELEQEEYGVVKLPRASVWSVGVYRAVFECWGWSWCCGMECGMVKARKSVLECWSVGIELQRALERLKCS